MIDQSILSERLIILDTETTGFEHDKGDRVIEVGLVETINREPTGRNFHVYVDPKRDVPEEAYAVHGLSRDDLVKLSGGRVFSQIADEMLEFIGDSPIVAHNASFDIRFLDAELANCDRPTISENGNIIIDSLKMANGKYPGQRNNLDALCRRLIGSENYDRELHGALLDATLLAQVFRIMTIQQNGLDLSDRPTRQLASLKPERLDIPAGALRLANVSESDKAAHQSFVAKIKKDAEPNHSMSSLDF